MQIQLKYISLPWPLFEVALSIILMFAPCINDSETLYYPTNPQYIICRKN